MNQFKVEMTIDPFKKTGDTPLPRIMQTLGMVPFWLTNPQFMDKGLIETLETQYLYGQAFRPLEETVPGASLSEHGIFKFHGDPDLYPIMTVKRKVSSLSAETFFQYPFALVGAITEAGQFWGRMD